jgi:hypothetical protein
VPANAGNCSDLLQTRSVIERVDLEKTALSNHSRHHIRFDMIDKTDDSA